MQTSGLARRGASAAAIGVLVLAVGSIGIADAADGGSLLLGQSNTATKTTTLTNSNGIPLSLHAGKGKAALQVNTKAMIKNLNAAEVGGLSAGKLASSGSGAAVPASLNDFVTATSGPSNGILLPAPTQNPDNSYSLVPVVVAATAPLKAGTYMVTAASTAEAAVCWVGTNKAVSTVTNYSLAEIGNSSVAGPYAVKKGQRLVSYCADFETGGNNTFVITGGITAIRPSSVAKGIAVSPTPMPTQDMAPNFTR